MLRGDTKKQDAAVKCLEVMSTSDNEHWKSIQNAGKLKKININRENDRNTHTHTHMDHSCLLFKQSSLCKSLTTKSCYTMFYLLGGISALVDLLKVENQEIQSVAASVLCNISENDEVRRSLTDAKAGPILILLLSSPVDEIQSRAAIILSDIACVDDNQDILAEQGAIPALINLLESELEDVLVNAVNAIRVLCTDNYENQTAVAQHGGVEPLVEFLGDTVNSGN